MEVEIDDYGRIVIPKALREKLGIEAGTSLEVRLEQDEHVGGAITLTPKGRRPPLEQKGELLVHSGKLTEEDFDVVDQIRSDRQRRARGHADLDR